MKFDESRYEEILSRPLGSGEHDDIETGMCVMEAVSYIAGEPWSDHPQCTCPTITSFMISWNDWLPSDEDRDRLLKPLIPQLIGTRGSDRLAERRSYMALDWLIRVHTPRWLDLTPSLQPHAEALRNLPEIVDLAGADAARAAARDAARDALKPTADWLQQSASRLVEQMCALQDEEEAAR